jgi:hypothetical protein
MKYPIVAISSALALAGALALLWPAQSEAAVGKSREATARAASGQQVAQARYRVRGGFKQRLTRRGTWSYTTRANGLCRRNTAVPLSRLNLRDRCDSAEFWRRQTDRGSR